MANEMRDRLVELMAEADAKCTNTVFCNECSACGKGRDCIDYNIADHLIENDVVPVVRCKDCKWLYKPSLLCTHKRNRVFNTGIKRDFNCYCNYGERKCE